LPVDAFPVQLNAVPTAEIVDARARDADLERGVLPGHQRIVEDELAPLSPPDDETAHWKLEPSLLVAKRELHRRLPRAPF
jgi:hypothetical protein